MRERIIVANVHGSGNQESKRLMTWFRQLGFTILILCEVHLLKDDFSVLGKLYTDPKDNPPDTGVLVSSRVASRTSKVLSWTSRKLAPFIRRPGTNSPRLWRDRWVVRVRIFNRVYYSVHAYALIANQSGEWLRNEGARVWREAMRELEQMILEDVNKNLRVRVGGDFNFMDTKEARDEIYSPADLFKRCNLKYISDGRVMYFAHTYLKDKMLEWRELPTVPGADAHGTLWVELRALTRKERKRLAA